MTRNAVLCMCGSQFPLAARYLYDNGMHAQHGVWFIEMHAIAHGTLACTQAFAHMRRYAAHSTYMDRRTQTHMPTQV